MRIKQLQIIFRVIIFVFIKKFVTVHVALPGGGHQDTKTQRTGMAFTLLSERPVRHGELRRGGRGRAYCTKEY